MIATLPEMMTQTPVLGLSRWLRTDLILAATLLFLVFASWALLTTSHTSVHRGRLGPPADQQAPITEPANSARDEAHRGSGPGRTPGTLGIVLGLLGSFTLLAICAW